MAAILARPGMIRRRRRRHHLLRIIGEEVEDDLKFGVLVERRRKLGVGIHVTVPP